MEELIDKLFETIDIQSNRIDELVEVIDKLSSAIETLLNEKSSGFPLEFLQHISKN